MVAAPLPPFGRILLNAPQINPGQFGFNDMTHFPAGIIHCCWSKKNQQIGENSHKEVQHHSTQQPTTYLDGWTNPTHVMWTLQTLLWNHHHHSTECLVENWAQGLMKSVLPPNSTIKLKQLESILITPCHRLSEFQSPNINVSGFGEVLHLLSQKYSGWSPASISQWLACCACYLLHWIWMWHELVACLLQMSWVMVN